MAFTSRPITFRTLSEIRREHGLPTVDDLRRQFPRRFPEEAAAAFEAAEAAADGAALAAAEAASAEAEELEIKCENLNPSASRAGTEPKLKGKSILKDLGESSKTENLSPAGASSGTKVEVKGSSVLKRPDKDLEEPIDSIAEYLNLAATDTASVTEDEVEGGSVRQRPRKDLSQHV